MTNQRESQRKAIYQKVGVDNCVFSVVSRVGECVLSSGFVYTLKCMSIVLVLGVCMKTVELKARSLVCYVQQSACRQTCRRFLLETYVTIPPAVSHISILLLTFIHRLLLTASIMLCHSITLLLGFGSTE